MHQKPSESTHWILVGPDEKQIKKIMSRAERVSIYAFGSGRWYEKINWEKFTNVDVAIVEAATVSELANSVQRNIRIQTTIQDGVGGAMSMAISM